MPVHPTKMLFAWKLLSLLLVVLFVTGCADLKDINKFSLNSSQVVAQPFPYGYSDYCYDSCYCYDTTFNASHYPCDCSIAISYDTAVAREAGKLVAYFTALAKLSGSDDIINVDTLAGAVPAGTYGKLTISATEAGLASGVATAIQDLVTAGFKSKHISESLHRYGNAVDSVLGSYIVHLEALDGQSHDLLIYLNTRLLVYRADAAPGYNRWAVAYSYSTKIKDLMERHAKFQKMIQLIQKVREGYHELVKNADNVKSKDLKKDLLALVNNITFLSNSSNK